MLRNFSRCALLTDLPDFEELFVPFTWFLTSIFTLLLASRCLLRIFPAHTVGKSTIIFAATQYTIATHAGGRAFLTRSFPSGRRRKSLLRCGARRVNPGRVRAPPRRFVFGSRTADGDQHQRRDRGQLLLRPTGRPAIPFA